jgi:hypothetical protein
MSFLNPTKTFITTRTYPSTQGQGYSNRSTSPFNDLWPPTYFPLCRPDQRNSFARSVWLHWLINGWTNDRPYRELNVLDYHPLSIENRRQIRLPTKRRQRLQARRPYTYTYKYINSYNLRNRVVPVRQRLRHANHPYHSQTITTSQTVTLGQPTGTNIDYSLTFP